MKTTTTKKKLNSILNENNRKQKSNKSFKNQFILPRSNDPTIFLLPILLVKLE